MSFWTEALPYAQQAHAQTGVLVSVVLAQWDDENGSHWPPPGNNPGNVGNPEHGGQTNYATIQEGVNAYIETMNLPYYNAVRHAVGYVDQAHALGQSPWAAGHYEASGPPPGQDLIKIIQANNLTQYDGAQPAPPTPSPQPPLPTEEETMSTIPFPTAQFPNRVLVTAVGAGTRPGDLLLFTINDPTNPNDPGYNVIDATKGIGTAAPYVVASA